MVSLVQEIWEDKKPLLQGKIKWKKIILKNRYIHTKLNKITRAIFVESDDHILQYNEDDGQLVEPEYYLPIIPTILVNGTDGIGTGWSTNIPCYNPRELVDAIKSKLKG